MKHSGRTTWTGHSPATGRPRLTIVPLALVLVGLLTGCSSRPGLNADTSAPPPTSIASDPAQAVLVAGWEDALGRGLNLEGNEADSTQFFRYQTLLTHIDLGRISREDATLRARAESIRARAAAGRDQAWLRWQVDVTPPPEPGIAEEGVDGLVIRPESNAQVDKWIDYFTGTGRERFAMWMWRAGTYRSHMEAILRQEGLPAEMIALVFIESGFNVTARSRAAAVGPWQFISATAKRYGLTVNGYRDERRDFELSTHSAARYLSDLYGMFGDWKLALAGYNCGEGRVFRQIAKQNTSNYWELSLPGETRDYVPKFFAALTIISQPEKYGFTSESAPPLAFEELSLPGPVRVDELARHCGVEVDHVKSMNPAWLHAITPADGSPVKARVPLGALARFSPDDLSLVPLSQARNVGGTHKVRRGETLSTIARKHGVSTSALARANRMTLKSVLRSGRTLKLPDGARVADSAGSSSSRAKRSKSGKGSGKSGTVHVVRSGDTFWSISQKYGVSLADVLRWNSATKRSVLKPGMKVRLAG